MIMKSLKSVSLCCLLSIFIASKSYSGNILNPSNPNSAVEQVSVGLYSLNADSTTSLDDGALTLYSPNYSNNVNWLEDAKKFTNFAENFAIKRDGQLMAIEKRQPIVSSDTTFFNMTHMRKLTYRLDFVTINFNHPNLFAYLQDNYTGISSPVKLNGDTTSVYFSITSDPGTSDPNRFRLVYSTSTIQSLSGVVPVTYSGVRAWQQDNGVMVEWKIANEASVKSYEVEKSTDGKQFTSLTTVSSYGNSIAANTYDWVDANPSTGTSYYRIKATSINGEVQYSQLLKINVGRTGNSVSVYPNPVVGNTMGLQMNNMAKGNYSILLVNTNGQVIMSKTLNHKEQNSAEIISLDKAPVKGLYRLEIIQPDNKVANINVAF